MVSKQKENWDYRVALNPDDIPSIQNPSFSKDYPEGKDTDTIIVVEGSSEVRGYPLRVLDFHEIVNDTVEGTPLTITWCPLCGSAIVFDRRVTVNGVQKTLTLGVRGALANDDMVMYDHETKSLWKQSMGECFEGELEGTSLEMYPSMIVSWKRFKEEYPDGLIVKAPGGKSEAGSADVNPVTIDYRDEPYKAYLEDDSKFGVDGKHGKQSRKWSRDDIRPKEKVLGIEHKGTVIGFPQGQVQKARGAVNETVGGDPIVVFDTSEGLRVFFSPK
eukprot:gb/GECG01012835.1/.p1 GENE.gb/GECG01012835.1/~~gb/GECG01012835.1/.p1  ORF type:complete len:274 (+),score=49.77 gb/GECG01012835.1/:1-822(+)